MIILAMDTTAVTASVALLEDDNVISSFSVHNKLTHSEKILPMIDNLLVNSGYTVDDVDLIGVSEGPGSFTGVRIGVSTAKGLAYPRNIPIVGVSALEALAYNFVLSTSVQMNCNVMIAPSMDARRNELYNAVFEYNGDKITRITEDRPISCEELYDELKEKEGKLFINGDGAGKLFDFLCVQELAFEPILSGTATMYQNAVSVGKIAYRDYLEGKYKNSTEITPLYLRTSQAERVKNKEI